MNREMELSKKITLLSNGFNDTSTDWKDYSPSFLLSSLTENLLEEIYQSQNPTTCTTNTKSLLCPWKSCGFGCQIHELVSCLSRAVFLFLI